MFQTIAHNYNFEELVTGNGLLLKKVHITKRELRLLLHKSEKKSLSELDTTRTELDKRQPKPCTTKNEVKDRSLSDVQVPESTEDKDANTHSHNGHHAGAEPKTKSVITFVVPYKLLTRNTIQAGRNSNCSVWAITDLKGTFGILVTCDIQPQYSYIGELWGITNFYRIAWSSSASKSMESQIPFQSRLVLSSSKTVRIGVILGFRLCLGLLRNGTVCETPFYVDPSTTDSSSEECERCSARRQALMKEHGVSSINPRSEAVKPVASQRSSCSGPATKRILKGSEHSLSGAPLKRSRASHPLKTQMMDDPGKEKNTLAASDEHNQCSKGLILEQTVTALIATLEDFLDNTYKDKVDAETLCDESHVVPSRAINPNLDSRILHLLHRLRTLHLPQELPSPCDYLPALRRLLTVMNRLTFNVKHYKLTQKTQDQVAMVVFLTKRNINTLLRDKQRSAESL